MNTRTPPPTCRNCGSELDNPNYCSSCGTASIEALISMVYPWKILWMESARDGSLSCLYLEHDESCNAALVVGEYPDNLMSRAWDKAADAVIRHKPHIDIRILSALKDERRDRLLRECLPTHSQGNDGLLSRLIKLRKKI